MSPSFSVFSSLPSPIESATIFLYFLIKGCEVLCLGILGDKLIWKDHEGIMNHLCRYQNFILLC
jgi:hypothetical protein